MKEQNLNNYHWTEGDITNYTKDYLKSKFLEHGYNVLSMNLEAFINQRMGKIGFVYFICASIEKNDRKIEIVDLDQFSDFTEYENEDASILKQIFDEYKKDAVKNCAQYVLEEKKANKNSVSKTVYYDVTRGEYIGEIISLHEILFDINCKKNEMVKYFTDKQFIEIWTNGNVQIEDNKITLFQEIVFNNIKYSNFCLICEWKHSSWNDYKDLTIKFEDKTDTCLVRLQYKNIEKEKTNNLAPMWERMILELICYKFNCRIINVKENSK